MHQLKIGQRVILLKMFGTPVGESIVNRLTPTRAVLANGLVVTLNKLQIYGENCRVDGETICSVALPTPKLEKAVQEYKDAKQQQEKLRNAKARLYDHIDFMRVGHFGKCTEQQIFAALEALDKIFGEKQ